jgi:hypothetical protein
MSADLLSDIRAFLTQTGMGPSYFGKAACGNSEIVQRLERGGTVTLITADRVRAFMRDNAAAGTSDAEVTAESSA